MQIVIPMSGYGERFVRAGYQIPKPLIRVQGEAMISHVLDMFPGEENVTLICNEEHLAEPEYRMREILRASHPRAKIVSIAAHKRGPIHAVQQIEHLLEPKEPVVINYVDFTCFWDWKAFVEFTETTKCAGVIPAYKGFHPHSLGATNYAYMREDDGYVQDIREKKPFTSNRMEEYASSGTYYFRSAELMSWAFSETLGKNRSVGGEYYVSLAYKALLESGASVSVYPLQHFVQWGTPEDVEEYNLWSSTFETLSKEEPPLFKARGTVVVPLAGLGKRFTDQGFPTPKPLIRVSGQPMFIQASTDLPAAVRYAFVMRSEMIGGEEVVNAVSSHFPGAVVLQLEQPTDGQAFTALAGLENLRDHFGSECDPLTIAASDSGSVYDREELERLLDDSAVDIIVWGFRGYPNAQRNPHMYGWVDERDGRIDFISVKEPLDNPASDPIVVGTFIFKQARHFHKCVEMLVARTGQINGEYYIDSLVNDAIQLGLNCQLFEITHYLNWGTPDDLRTFEYWQSFFSKWELHPYSLEKDRRVPKAEIPLLEEKFSGRNFRENLVS